LLASIRGIGNPSRLLWSEWQRIHARERLPAALLSRTPLVVLTSAVVLLALLEYFGKAPYFGHWLAALEGGGGRLGPWAAGVRRGPYLELWSCAFWSLSCFVCYLLVPALVVRMVLKERPSGYGLSPRTAFGHGGVYLALYVAVLPLVVLASFGPAFQRTYPFYSQAGRSAFDFVAFESLYALQFLSLEFFFRGFLLHSLKRHLGAYAIFVMTVPYAMIHFGKPFPETLGAVVAGLVLGTLSLSTGSIWGGVLIHVAVALTMDVLALWQRGAF
jgi:membrane protease YdiL (CAAX protease family)